VPETPNGETATDERWGTGIRSPKISLETFFTAFESLASERAARKPEGRDTPD